MSSDRTHPVAECAVDRVAGAQHSRDTRDNSLSLLHFTADLTRREADLLRFPASTIAPRIDPAGWAESTIQGSATDLIFAANEARLAGDLETLLHIQQMVERLLVHLGTVETLAVKYADEILRDRGAK